MEVFRRRVDMDELYESTPWMLCPFGGTDEACREEHTEKVRKGIAKKVEQWEGSTNKYREESKKDAESHVRVSPEEIESVAKRVRTEEAKEVTKAHTDTVEKAVYAGSTSDIDVDKVL